MVEKRKWEPLSHLQLCRWDLSTEAHWPVLGVAPTSHQERPIRRSFPLIFRYGLHVPMKFCLFLLLLFYKQPGCIPTQVQGICLGISSVNLMGKPYSNRACSDTHTHTHPFSPFLSGIINANHTVASIQ